MPSPFPGMDPYLEDAKRWPAFHHQLAASLYQILLPSLVDRYRARVNSRTYTTELPLFTSIIKEDRTEEFIELRDRSDGHLVTLIDIVSPANRTTSLGRDSYMATRTVAEQQRAAIVEIDLVTQGQPMLDYPRDNLPEHDYTITVTRPSSPGKFEIYTSTIAKRLPKFRLPLAMDDKDTALELQDVFRRAYDLAGFSSIVDYKSAMPPDVRFPAATRSWIDSHLQKHRV
jgi:hypothetical protein